jgi:hypothetical protein
MLHEDYPKEKKLIQPFLAIAVYNYYDHSYLVGIISLFLLMNI